MHVPLLGSDAFTAAVRPSGTRRSQHARMLTVWLPMCSTVAPMARAGGGDIPGNSLGQGLTNHIPLSNVQGASGAPTGAVEGAAGGQKCANSQPSCMNYSRTA